MNIVSRDDAIRIGAVRYFTGIPCKRGHVSERRVTSWECVACANTLAAQRFLVHPEKKKSKDKAYYHRHKTVLIEKAKAYYLKHRAQRIARVNELRSIDMQKRPHVYRERVRKNRATHPERWKAYANNRRAREVGHVAAAWIKELHKLQRGRCPVCTEPLPKAHHLDHIMPLYRGGRHEKGNVQLLCGPCNARKHAKDPIRFMQERGFLL